MTQAEMVRATHRNRMLAAIRMMGDCCGSCRHMTGTDQYGLCCGRMPPYYQVEAVDVCELHERTGRRKGAACDES